MAPSMTLGRSLVFIYDLGQVSGFFESQLPRG